MASSSHCFRAGQHGAPNHHLYHIEAVGQFIRGQELENGVNVGFFYTYRQTDSRDDDEQAYKAIRCLQLYVGMVNVVYQDLVFTWKLASLGMSIISGYAAIAHFTEHPVFGIMYYGILIDVTLVYTIIYGKAFKTPDLFKQAVDAELMRLGTERGGGIERDAQRKVLTKQIRSIPSIGFKVGHFHTLERTSTPVFLDFVISNIVSMLVVFA